MTGINEPASKEYEPYKVTYSNAIDIEGELNSILKKSGSVNAFRGLAMDQFAERMAALYVELDYLHPFNEGNSRALRFLQRSLQRQRVTGLIGIWAWKALIQKMRFMLPAIRPS